VTPPSRNGPCPCGSGAKYKRCCLAKDEQERHRAANEAQEAARKTAPRELDEEDLEIEDELDRNANLAAAVDRPFDEDRAPWELAKIAEESETFARARARDEAWAAIPALPGEIERLGDDDLRSRLEGLGARITKSTFLEAARAALERGSPNGWTIAATWRAGLGRELARGERDFLALAACELWHRWFPEEPSTDALEDMIEEGYALLEEEQGDEALAVWREVLDVVLARRPEGARSVADVKAAGDAAYLSTWLEDWLDEVHARAQDDPGIALVGLRLVDELLAALPDQGGPSGGTMRAARSSFLVTLGRDEEALAEARTLRDARPDLAIGYIALADAFVATGDRDPASYARAIEVINVARSRPVTDAKEWALEERYRELTKMLGRARAGS
jgi:hypothetical protein